MNIAIIGAGPLGIAAGRELLQQGFKRFTIFEKEDAPGGTWHMQTYPGLACDVWAHSYSYSYAPNPDWSSSFVNQPEIEAYLQKCARDFGLEPHLACKRCIVAAELQPDNRWLLRLDDGEEQVFDAVINAMGNQHTPVFPDLPGMQNFKGSSWHSAQYDHSVDLSGKKVTVIGSAAAAVQIVPEIAPVVGHLNIIQRSPNWIVPRNNKTYSGFTKNLFRKLPFVLDALRAIQGTMMRFVHGAVIMDSKRMQMFENMGLKFIDEAIEDPELKKLVTPKSRYGCKRPLVSDGFYPALNRDNVSLVASAAKSITENAVITEDGREIESDVIIYCTGYRVMDFDRFEVIGKGGKKLADEMKKGPYAYKGILVPDFPNYFMGMGPNAVVLSVSYFKSAEANVKCIVDLLSAMCKNNVKTIDVKPELHKAYNEWVVENCKQFSWGSGTCHNYYMNEDGHAPFLYPGDYKSFLAMRADCGIDQFLVE